MNGRNFSKDVPWFVLVAILMFVPTSASAQFSYQPPLNLWPQINTYMSVTPVPLKFFGTENQQEDAESPNVAQSRVIAQSLESLKFRSSQVVRKRNIGNFVAKTRAVDPVGAAKMQELFDTTDIFAEIQKGLTPFGLRIDNLADAYTVYWVNAWLGSRGRTDSLSRQEIGAVRQQAANALAGTKEIASANESQKQEFAEALLIQAALIESHVEDAKSDPTQMNKVKAAIAQGAEAMGLDLYSITLSPNGFIPAKRGSAVKEDELQLASESTERSPALTEPAGPGDSPNYVLIAAAGGAGLGGMFLLGKAMGRKR